MSIKHSTKYVQMISTGGGGGNFPLFENVTKVDLSRAPFISLNSAGVVFTIKSPHTELLTRKYIRSSSLWGFQDAQHFPGNTSRIPAPQYQHR